MAGGARRIGRLGDWLGQHRTELKLGLRITVAGLVTFALAHLLNLAQSYWAVITAVFVIQASLGASLKASLDRLIGTLAGSAWGVAVSLAIPHGNVLALGSAVAVALAPLGLVAAFRPTYRIAPITAIIVLVGSTNQAAGPLASAADRVIEIGLGSLIGVGVALLVLPGRAHGHLAEAAGRALELMGEQIGVMLAGLAAGADTAAVQRLHDSIRGAIARAEAQAAEAAVERAHRLTDAPDPEPLVRTLRRIHHDLIMIGRAAAERMPEKVAPQLAAPAAAVAVATAAFLRGTGAALARHAPPPSLDGIEQALGGFAAAMAGIRREGLTRNLPDETAGRIFGLAFALEQLRRNLEDLANRARELAPERR